MRGLDIDSRAMASNVVCSQPYGFNGRPRQRDTPPLGARPCGGSLKPGRLHRVIRSALSSFPQRHPYLLRLSSLAPGVAPGDTTRHHTDRKAHRGEQPESARRAPALQRHHSCSPSAPTPTTMDSDGCDASDLILTYCRNSAFDHPRCALSFAYLHRTAEDARGLRELACGRARGLALGAAGGGVVERQRNRTKG
jgi:hypothetical protein